MRKLHLALLSLGVAAALPTMATTVTTTSYSTWTSAAYTTGSNTVLDFSGQTNSYPTSAGFTENGYIFTGPDGAGYSLSLNYVGGNEGLLGANDGTGDITVTLPGSGSNAIYLFANTTNGATFTNGPIALTLSDGETFSIASGQMGLSVSHPITSFTLSTSTPGQSVFLYEAHFGTSSLTQDAGTGGTGGSGDPAPTPEAATLALVGGGALVLFGARRKFTQRLAV